MITQLGIENIKADITFLTKNETNRFADMSIDDVIQLMLRKKDHKQKFKNSTEYQELKGRMKKVKMAKLPFRIVELVNESWKYGKCLPYRVELNTGVRDGKLESQQRKKQKRIFRSKLITQAKPHEDALHIFEQINLLHGTNSALLPMIDETLELIPSGRLLDQGRAPMGGEIDKGGMRGANTVNQHTLSADTIRNISLCWDYAFRISNRAALPKTCPL